MNKTTVKRGIGAVLLALIAAGLLAFLLKDKADERQELVDMPLPGSEASEGTTVSDSNTKLPQLSMDSSTSIAKDGEVIASAGVDKAASAVDSATGAVAATAAGVGAAASGVIASATGSGDKEVDFNVRPPAAASSDFRDLSDVDLINNGTSTAASTASSAASTVASTAAAVTASAPAASTSTSTPRPSNTTRGNVIASAGSGGQARLIDETTAKPPRSARTERVISSRAAAPSSTRQAAPAPKPAPKPKAAPAPAPTAKPAPAPSAPAASGSGYAIQLLATSSASRAQSLVNVMRGEGYKAYTTKVTQNGKLLYRVRIGQYANKASATNAQNAMKRRYKKNADVNRSAVVRQ